MFLRRKRYQVKVTGGIAPAVSVTAKDWTEVRHLVGMAVEDALSLMPEGKRVMAYTGDVQQLNASLTGTEAESLAKGTQGWTYEFSTIPLAVTIHHR